MTAFVAWRDGGPKPYLASRARALAFLLCMSGAVGPAALAADLVPGVGQSVSVLLDQAKVVKLPDGIATLVVGNPLIADVTVQPGNMLIITGKGYGVTNLVAMDRGGVVLMESSIEVQGPRTNLMVVYRGIERESYSCTPVCERRITLGDSAPYFSTTMSQTGLLTNQAQGPQQQR